MFTLSLPLSLFLWACWALNSSLLSPFSERKWLWTYHRFSFLFQNGVGWLTCATFLSLLAGERRGEEGREGEIIGRSKKKVIYEQVFLAGGVYFGSSS